MGGAREKWLCLADWLVDGAQQPNADRGFPVLHVRATSRMAAPRPLECRAMAKLHLWVGNFGSAKLLRKYMDQAPYLAAWAAYDHGLPGGADEGSEPDPAGRCAFCQEIGFDTFDEDALIARHYARSPSPEQAAGDVLVDEKALAALLKKHRIAGFDALVAYQDPRLATKDASGAVSMRYLGQLAQRDAGAEGAEGGPRRVHHLWVGEGDPVRARVLEAIGVDRREVVLANVIRPAAGTRLDETLVTRVDDLFVAENMILESDRMKIEAACAIVHLVLDGSARIDGEQVGAVLGLRYVGRFAPA